MATKWLRESWAKNQRRKVIGGGHNVQQIEGIAVLTFKLVEELRIARSCERSKTVPYAVKQGAQGLRPAAGGLPAGATAGVGRGGGGEPRAPLGRRQEATVATATTTALGELPAHINVPRVQVASRARRRGATAADRWGVSGPHGGRRWRRRAVACRIRSRNPKPPQLGPSLGSG